MISTPLADAGPKNLVELLDHRARSGGGGYTFLTDGESSEAHLSLAELAGRARAIGHMLAELDASGQRVLLLYPPGLDYVAAFFGCLYAGAVAVPAFPPDPTRLARTLPRLAAVVKDADARIALTTDDILAMSPYVFELAPELAALRWASTTTLTPLAERSFVARPGEPESLAFLQYTSGSTGTPKGVMLSHANLLHNQRLIQQAFAHGPNTRVAGWLPLYHDMGLIGNLLQPLYLGVPCVLMSPVAFLQRPLRWLQMISKYRATTSGGPNFAYDLCVRKVTMEERAALDLSSWTVAFNGAEPIRAATLDRFVEAFGPCGFRRQAFYPCYGLAEATLIVSGGTAGDPPVVRSIDREALTAGRASPASGDRATSLVGSGRTLGDQEIRVVAPESCRPCADGVIGEVWVRGGSVAAGYWQRREATEEIFKARLADGAGPFLRTGDLGFIADGQLFITGRQKDLIILRGRNVYPQDLELSVEQIHPALRPGCGAAFAIEVDGEERAVLVHELDLRQRDPRHNTPELCDPASGELSPERVLKAIQRVISEEHEVQVEAVLLVKPGSIPKTSSGKIQRRATRAAFESGQLDALASWRRTDGTRSAAAQPASVAAPLGGLIGRLQHTVGVVLGVPPATIDPARSLSSYGLDSLAAVELQHAVGVELGREVALGALLGGITLTELAREMEAGAATPPAAIPSTISAESGPLSFGQEALWFVERLAPESAAYKLAAALTIHGRMDARALQRAFERVVARHPALRLRFSVGPDGAQQRVCAEAPPFFSVVLHTGSAADLSVELEREANRSIDLERGPLLRVTLYQTSGAPPTLLFVIHHLVTDFWSLGMLVDQLGALYAEEIGGPPAKLPPASIEYADYVRWQRGAAAPASDAAWAYWQRELAGELPVLALPVDRPRPRAQHHRGASHAASLDPEATRRLRAFADTEGATPFMVLLSAFELLLHRYTGQAEVIVGISSTGRTRPELAGVMGYFVNPLPMRMRIGEQESFRAVTQRVRSLLLAGLSHQELPFPQLVSRLGVVRDPSRPPVFQVMFVMQQASRTRAPGLAALALGEAGARMAMADLELVSYPLRQRSAPFELTVMLAEQGEGIAVSFQYDADLFEAQTIAQMAAHYARLVDALVAAPDDAALASPMLSAAETRQQLVTWGKGAWAEPAPPLAGGPCLHHLFEAQAARTPDALAVVYGADQLSFAQLEVRANQLAHHLRKQGVRGGGIVGLLLDRSAEMVVALLGIWKAGCAYLPLDPEQPAGRIRRIFEIAGVTCCVTTSDLAAASACASVVLVDRQAAELSACASAPPQVAGSPSDGAYVIFTSGSTGDPKGVFVEHRSVINLIAGLRSSAYSRFSAPMRVSINAPLIFDASVQQVVSMLWGCTLCPTPRVARTDLAAMANYLREQRIEVLDCTPSHLELMLEEGLFDDEEQAPRLVLCGGEAINPSLWAALRRRRRPTVFNVYGPTECTVDATGCELGSVGEEPTIGRPLDGFCTYVLDDDLRLLPRGAAGELFIGGVGVARGYLERPDLTGERFLPDPYCDGAGTRMYRTGDLARWRADGQLEYLGRADRQVKVRGFRIELGEIEAKLRLRPEVRDAIVVVREDAPGKPQLVAYVVGAVPVASELRAHLRQFLPEYMLPSTFVAMDALPLTPNGKIDRRALPAPEPVGDAAAYQAPATPMEEALAAIWSDVLGVERVGVRDDFFALGGDSISSIRVVARAKAAGIAITPRQLFERPTIGALAQVADTVAAVEAERSSSEAPVAQVDQATVDRLIASGRDVEDVYPLSPLQEGILFHSLSQPKPDVYFIQVQFRIRRLDVERFRRAWQRVIERHAVFRTGVLWQGVARPLQVVERSVPLSLGVEDWSGLDAAAQGVRFEQYLSADRDRGFDLRQAPIFRFQLFRLDRDTHRFVLSVHHLLVDGWSASVLLQELLEAYRADAPLTKPVAPYRRYIEWLARQDRAAAERYWRGALGDFHTPTLADRGDATARGHLAATNREETRRLPATATLALRELARTRKLSLNTLVRATWALLLYRFSGRADVVFGATVSGRPAALHGVEDMVGLFINTVPVRVRVDPRQRFAAWAAGLQEEQQARDEHEHASLSEIHGWSGVPRTQPLFESYLLFQNYTDPLSLTDPNGALGIDEHRHMGQSTVPLSLVVVPGGAELSLMISHDARRFPAATVDGLFSQLTTLLEQVATAPDLEIGAIEWRLPAAASLREAASPEAPRLDLWIAASFTAEPIAPALELWLDRVGIPAQADFAGFNQVFQELLDPTSRLSTHHGVNLVLVRLEDLVAAQPDAATLGRAVDELLTALRARERPAPTLLCVCPPSPRLVADADTAAALAAAEERLHGAMATLTGIYFLGSRELQRLYPVPDYHDRIGEQAARVPFTPKAYAVLGARLARAIAAVRRPPLKVLVLDCDNTLWTGVCGEDGAEGVGLDPHRIALQRFVVAQHDAGMLICLNSKNEADDVWEVFARRGEMPLKREHVVASRINWTSKADNLVSLADELSLGLNSFVFVDDNPIECAQVRAALPQVLTVELPAAGAEAVRCLEHVWALDRLKVTAEDQQRTRMYQQEAAREVLRGGAGSLAEFIGALELKVRIAPLGGAQIERMAQLTQRTNQFNTSGIRRTTQEVAAIERGGPLRCLTIDVSDRFGEYGLVGAIVFTAGERLRVDTLLLSCRVLGRGVEHRLLRHLGELAIGLRITDIEIPFQKLKRNEPALRFLRETCRLEGGAYHISAGDAAALSYLPAEAPAEEAATGEAQPPPASEDLLALRLRHEPFVGQLWDPEEILRSVTATAKKQARGDATPYLAPRTEVEQVLAEIWCQLLNLDRVGVRDDFFEIGGHSLQCVQMLSEIGQRLDVELSMSIIFEIEPTIEELARRISEHRVASAPAELLSTALDDLDRYSDEEVRALLAAEES